MMSKRQNGIKSGKCQKKFFDHKNPSNIKFSQGLWQKFFECRIVKHKKKKKKKVWDHFLVSGVVTPSPNPFLNDYPEKVYFRSQILERPRIGKYWNISGVPVLSEMWYLRSLDCAGVIQKLTILEYKNGLVLSNTHVPVSGTSSILFPTTLPPGRMVGIFCRYYEQMSQKGWGKKVPKSLG